MITKTDLLLLTRVGKILGAEADTIKQSNAPWDGSAESREQKRRYDRMLREQRDLADLRARLALSKLLDEQALERERAAPPALPGGEA